MALIQFFLILLLCAVALGTVARRFDFPYPIALVIGGGALGFIPGLPQVPFNPDLILFLVLPPILYQAAMLTSWRDFKANGITIALLSVGLVIATTVAVGAALKLMVPEMPWAAALVFGAIVSPPDAVAATAILSRLNIPRRVVNVLEGESLVNDASALVLYKFAVAAVLTGSFSLVEASTEFVGIALGGIAAGLACGMVFLAVHRYLGDLLIEVLTSLLVPYVAYLVAESFHVSGVLAVVAAGLLRGRHTPIIASADMRMVSRAIGNVLVFLLNTMVFVMMGMQLSGIVERMQGYSVFELVCAGALLSAVAIAVRFAWIYPAFYLPNAVGRYLKRRGEIPPEAEYFIMSWCGMRGIVSLAAALALPPVLSDGSPFPYRDPIIFFTFVIIAVTLVLQGLSLPVLIRRLNVGTDWRVHEEQANARSAMSTAATAAIDELAVREKAPPELAGRISAEFAEKVANSEPGSPMSEQEAGLAQRLRHAALMAEREALIRLWRDNQISDEVLHQFEEALDHQEAHL
jgi:CPA1 family monovalent cation:H+ antiporter